MLLPLLSLGAQTAGTAVASPKSSSLNPTQTFNYENNSATPMTLTVGYRYATSNNMFQSFSPNIFYYNVSLNPGTTYAFLCCNIIPLAEVFLVNAIGGFQGCNVFQGATPYSDQYGQIVVFQTAATAPSSWYNLTIMTGSTGCGWNGLAFYSVDNVTLGSSYTTWWDEAGFAAAVCQMNLTAGNYTYGSGNIASDSLQYTPHYFAEDAMTPEGSGGCPMQVLNDTTGAGAAPRTGNTFTVSSSGEYFFYYFQDTTISAITATPATSSSTSGGSSSATLVWVVVVALGAVAAVGIGFAVKRRKSSGW